MRVILDTGAFFHPAQLRELGTRGDDVVVPAVAYAERLRQVVLRGGSAAWFDAVLLEMGFDVEPFGPVQARRVIPGVRDTAAWHNLARDAMIAGHVEPDDQLWTTNPRDFLALGMDPAQLVDLNRTPSSGLAFP